MNIEGTVRRLLPNGSNGKSEWDVCPEWPPDVFAVVATLIESNGCYAKNDVLAPGRHFNTQYRRRVSKASKTWAATMAPDPHCEQLWLDILDAGQTIIGCASGDECARWELSALELLAIADETSAGMGFSLLRSHTSRANGSSRSKQSESLFNQLWFEAVSDWEREKAGGSAEIRGDHRVLPYIPYSICNQVPAEVACVQPKTSTPSVGCTLRSLSHHLALLPSRGIVETNWRFGYSREEGTAAQDTFQDKPMNLLLLPMPYELQGESFEPVGLPADSQGYFRVKQTWLMDEKGQSKVDEIVEWVCQAIRAAMREVGKVHAVVFPEAALDRPTFDAIGQRISTEFEDLELLIAGVMERVGASKTERNIASIRRYAKGKTVVDWDQSKHHRWKLDPGQVRMYHLGHSLSPKYNWWESIEISRRQCTFAVVRPWATLAVLICEDLARVDPVLPAINSVGPSLLIALLMDGAQLPHRWSARYASVLADDPGCSVLTFTSAGSVNRSRPMDMPASARVAIALWKQPGGQAQTLYLEPGCQGLVLSLVTNHQTQYTLDGRSDEGAAQVFSVGAAMSIRVPEMKPRHASLHTLLVADHSRDQRNDGGMEGVDSDTMLSGSPANSTNQKG